MALFFHCLKLHNKEMEVRSSRDSAFVIDIACWNAYCDVWDRLVCQHGLFFVIFTLNVLACAFKVESWEIFLQKYSWVLLSLSFFLTSTWVLSNTFFCVCIFIYFERFFWWDVDVGRFKQTFQQFNFHVFSEKASYMLDSVCELERASEHVHQGGFLLWKHPTIPCSSVGNRLIIMRKHIRGVNR